MPRYSGKLGLAEQTEISPGVWEETITEHDVLGEVKQRTEAFVQGDSILPQYRTTTSVSVFFREAGVRNNSDIRYLTYGGDRWTPSSIVSKGPRLVLYIGEVYRGPTPSVATDP